MQPRSGIDSRQALGQSARNLADVARVELDVGVALRMHVAVAAVEADRHLERRDESPRFEVARRAWSKSCVAGLLDQHRQPADLEVESGADDEIGVAHPGDQARPGLDAMRILGGRRRRADAQAVTADLFCERRPFGFTGDHVERGVGLRAEQENQCKRDQAPLRQRDRECVEVHRDVLRSCGHHAHRGS
jgi:hypothetical protein